MILWESRWHNTLRKEKEHVLLSVQNLWQQAGRHSILSKHRFGFRNWWKSQLGFEEEASRILIDVWRCVGAKSPRWECTAGSSCQFVMEGGASLEMAPHQPPAITRSDYKTTIWALAPLVLAILLLGDWARRHELLGECSEKCRG